MALIVYWYDFICFGIVGVSCFVALYVLWRREGAGKSREDKSSMYEYQSLLLVSRADDDGDGDGDGNGNGNVGDPIGHVSSSQLWSTCWRGLHPIWLLGLRLASLAILCGFLAWDIHSYDASIFVYYTEWTFTLVIVYFTIGTIVSAHGCTVYYYSNSNSNSNSKKPAYDNGDVEESRILPSSANGNGVTVNSRVNKETRGIKLQTHYTTQNASAQRAGFWGYLMQTAYQTCAGAVILTDIVFWCIIVPFLSNAHYELNMLMGCMHTLNAVLLLLDTSVNSLPFPWFRLAYFVLWSCCYAIFQWVIHACGFSWWPYPFLELSTPWAPVWYLSLALVHIPCYGLYSLLVRAKNSIFPRLFPRAFVSTC